MTRVTVTSSAKLASRNTWIYRGKIKKVEPPAADGDPVSVYDESGRFLGTALYSLHGIIALRFIAFKEISFDWGYVLGCLAAARRLRDRLYHREPGSAGRQPGSTGCPDTDTYRLFYAEGDGIPGLIIDRYADFFYLLFTNPGAGRFADDIVAFLREECGLGSGVIADQTRGIIKRVGLVPELVPIREQGLGFLADLTAGQKTGFFLDQRLCRDLVRTVSRDRTVLNLFAYTGAFAVCAMAGGARGVTNVDGSQRAAVVARETFRRQELTGVDFVTADVFQFLEQCRESYDLIILDPPYLSKKSGDLTRIRKAMYFLHERCLRLLPDSGMLITSSCTASLTETDFRKIIHHVFKNAGREGSVIQVFSQPPDHPENIYQPDNRYLTTFAIQCR